MPYDSVEHSLNIPALGEGLSAAASSALKMPQELRAFLLWRNPPGFRLPRYRCFPHCLALKNPLEVTLSTLERGKWCPFALMLWHTLHCRRVAGGLRQLCERRVHYSFPVTISVHKTLNSFRGVVSEPNLWTTPETEIHERFSNQGVIQVKDITKKML
ncbi:hypothetical protein TNCV_227091 [Trichonephila clavipes]|nr:hypothetical protein TNCV_227091 [Trichonephila clavipes]